jgi:hypothetical protein
MKIARWRCIVLIGVFAGAAQSADRTKTLAAVECTATGWSALVADTTGEYNTADGWSALMSNTTATYNTAVGAAALKDDLSGSYNTAVGVAALGANLAKDNTAVGFRALGYNTAGTQNTAIGKYALGSNNTGEHNTAAGYGALFFNAASNNTAVGVHALSQNMKGTNNIAMGYEAGRDATGSDNIDLGNVGIADESATIRVGTQDTHTATYIAGINGAQVTGSAVYVTSAGQLGVLASSERYKTAIAPMGTSSEKIGQLRPVTFRLKSDPGGPVQYGLIAEEVDKIYPELVLRDRSGAIQGVRYDELAPMLVNEIQQLERTLTAQSAMIETQAKQFRAMRNELTELRRRDHRHSIRDTQSSRDARVTPEQSPCPSGTSSGDKCQ